MLGALPIDSRSEGTNVAALGRSALVGGDGHCGCLCIGETRGEAPPTPSSPSLTCRRIGESSLLPRR